MRGHQCIYICADDTHGTPIMLKAKERNITPEELIAESKVKHEKDFAGFQIEFDNFGSTNSEQNREVCYEFYEKMKNNNLLKSREIEQNYCEHDKMFLPDRFVKGTCPKCKSEDQYGDSCDVCGSTYSSTDLENKVCSICKNTPVLKKSEHIFFNLNEYRDFLSTWVPSHTQVEIANKLKEWLSADLKDWDISRDEPYFGFEFPDKPGKFFYVWVDAPIGYIASTLEWGKKMNIDSTVFWKPESDTELYHFIGKDIVYFHTLFWPAMLKCAGYKTPDKIFVHGFLKINGEKMSKSKGTFILARTFIDHLNSDYLRYYFASKLSSSIDDIDLNFSDFLGKVNSEFIGKITNLVSRGAQMLHKKLDGKTGTLDSEAIDLITSARNRAETVFSHYENRDFNRVIAEVRDIADETNRYFDAAEPWNLVKVDKDKTLQVLTTTINMFRIIAIYLKPVLPHYVQKVETLLQDEPYDFNSLNIAHENRPIHPYEHLATRIEQRQIDDIIKDSSGF